MADKVQKPKKKAARSKGREKGVMAALPSTRPERIGGARTAGQGPPAPKTATVTAASRRAAEPPAKPTATARAKPRPKAAARPKVTAARRKAAAPRTFEPTRAAEAAAGAADERALGAVPLAETPPKPRDAGTAYPRPRAVREGAPGIGTTGYRDTPPSERGRPLGVSVMTTAIQTAAELAQVGLGLGGRVVKGAVSRLPKP